MCVGFLLCLFYEFCFEHESADTFDATFYFFGRIGEANVFDLGPFFEGGAAAFDLEVLDNKYRIAIGEHIAIAVGGFDNFVGVFHRAQL